MWFLLWFSCAKSCCSGIALCTWLSSVPLAERTAATSLPSKIHSFMTYANWLARSRQGCSAGVPKRISGTFKTCPQEWQLFYKIHEHTSIYLDFDVEVDADATILCLSEFFSWFSSGLGRQLREYLDRSFAQEAGVWAGLMIYNIYIFIFIFIWVPTASPPAIACAFLLRFFGLCVKGSVCKSFGV